MPQNNQVSVSGISPNSTQLIWERPQHKERSYSITSLLHLRDSHKYNVQNINEKVSIDNINGKHYHLYEQLTPRENMTTNISTQFDNNYCKIVNEREDLFKIDEPSVSHTNLNLHANTN